MMTALMMNALMTIPEMMRAPTGPDPQLPKSDPEPRPGSAPDYQPSPVPPTPDTDMPGMPDMEPAI